MPSQIQILNTHLTGKEKSLASIFFRKSLTSLKIADVFNMSSNLSEDQFKRATFLLCNPISQQLLHSKHTKKILEGYGQFKWVVEIRYLPGVTDNVGHTAEEIIKENLKNIKTSLSVGSAQLLFLNTSEKLSLIHI